MLRSTPDNIWPWLGGLTAFALATSLAPGVAQASYIPPPPTGIVSPTPDPIPPGSGFSTPGTTCLPAPFSFCVSNLQSSHFDLEHGSPTFPGGNEDLQYQATYTGTFTDAGGLTQSFSVTGYDEFVLFGRGSATQTGNFPAQLVNEMVTVPPTAGHTLSLLIDTGPAQLSNANGDVDISPLVGGGYDITSSFALSGDFTVDGIDLGSNSFSITGVPVPEPSGLACLGLGALALFGTGRRQRRS